jgi:uncharacterized iron-regulated membrane protein
MRARTMTNGEPVTAARPRRIELRRIWVQIHLWLGLTLGVLGAGLGVTGSLLVFDQAIDARLNPQRYATSGSQVALPFADYAQRAALAVGKGGRALNMRFPQADGTPVVVFVRAPGDTGSLRRVYLDPPTGRVLDAPAGAGLIGWAHDFHESLKLREYSGRQIVGVVGISMLVSALSGLYLWWPRRRFARTDFAFRPNLATSRNLHYMFGFYGSLVLAMLSFTGVTLAFPDAVRATVAMFTEISAPQRNVQAAESSARAITADQATDLARESYPKAAVAAIGFPAGTRGAYRIALREPGDDSARGATTVFVDPGSGAILRQLDRSTQTKGDAFLAYQRPLHEGGALGLAGRVIVCIVGWLPLLFVVTGAMIWLRTRRRRTAAV